MLTLDPRPVFDPWRTCGADIPAATSQALAIPAQTGTTEILEQHAFPNGTIIRGATFAFPKPLVAVYGTGQWGPSGSPGYSWGGEWLTLAPNSQAIFMDCTFTCHDAPTAPHHQEKGYNVWGAIPDSSQLILIDCTVINADSAVVLGGTNSHAFNLTLQATRLKNTEGRFGHYGVRVTGEKNVLEGCDVQTLFHHDVSTQVTKNAVYKDVQGIDLVMDFHAWSGDDNDDNNLYYHINVGKGTRIIGAGGAASNLPWDGDGATFYDIRKGDGSFVTSGAYPAWLHPTLIPISSDPLPPEEPMPQFVPGDTVQATSQLNVREQPKKASLLLGTQPTGAQASVLAGPTNDTSTAIVFYQLHFATGASGWVGADRLVKVNAPPDPKVTAKQKLLALGLTDAEASVVINP